MTIISLTPYILALITWVIALGMWQYQLITKRRYEIAEQALSAAGKAVSSLHHIRNAKIDMEIETEELGHKSQETWLVTQQRLQDADAIFSHLRTCVQFVEMHFGSEATRQFDELSRVYSDMCIAQKKIHFRSPALKMYPSDDFQSRLQSWKDLLISEAAPDPTFEKINSIHQNIVNRYQKYLRPSLFRLFVPYSLR